MKGAYHTGVVVADLDSAMAAYGAVLPSGWTRVEEIPLTLGTPAGAQQVTARIVYSVDGPNHVELIESAPGTVWADPGPHHVGVWSADLAGDSAALEAAGSPAVAWAVGRGGRRVGFCYHRLATGELVELVDTRSAGAFARWLAGGRYR